MNDEGVQKSAILLMSLGEEGASQVFKHLAPREVQKLGAAMSSYKNVSRAELEVVLTEFRSQVGEKSTLGMDSDEYVRRVLINALGEDKAAELISHLHGSDTAGIEGLRWMGSPEVAELIKNEHPQIIATILVHLDLNQTCEILGFFTDRLRKDVLLRIATLDGIQPAALRELNDVLTTLISSSGHVKKSTKGGIRAAAEILNFMPTAQETTLIEGIKAHDPDLAQKILDQMFVFDNLVDVDDRGIQLLLREIQSESLVVALKGVADALREKIFKNMSQRAAETLKEDLEAKGPVRVSEVEAAQKEILKIARRLADEGQIALGAKSEDSFI